MKQFKSRFVSPALTKQMERILVKYFFPLLPYLLIVSYVGLGIDTIAFPGFFRKYLLLDPLLLFFITSLGYIAITWKEVQQDQLKNEQFNFWQFVLYVNRLLLFPILISYYIFLTLEKEHYPNYVFSQFHIHISGLRNLTTLTLFILTVDIITNHTEVLSFLRTRITSIVQMFFIVSIAAVVIPQINDTATMITVGSIDILRYPFKSYDEKFVAQMNGNNAAGWVYTYAQFINRHTDVDAVIFIPPQIEPWLMEGNQYYISWFLFPRKVIYTRDLNAPIPPEVTDVMIAHGTWEWGATSFGWPRISIPKESISNISLIDKKSLQEYDLGSVDYVWRESPPQWGIINLEK